MTIGLFTGGRRLYLGRELIMGILRLIFIYRMICSYMDIPRLTNLILLYNSPKGLFWKTME